MLKSSEYEKRANVGHSILLHCPRLDNVRMDQKQFILLIESAMSKLQNVPSSQRKNRQCSRYETFTVGNPSCHSPGLFITQIFCRISTPTGTIKSHEKNACFIACMTLLKGIVYGKPELALVCHVLQEEDTVSIKIKDIP